MVKSSSFETIWSKRETSTAKAFAETERRLGLHQSPEVLTYSQLSPDDFADLAKDFGETNVLQYIQELEKKKLLSE